MQRRSFLTTSLAATMAGIGLPGCSQPQAPFAGGPYGPLLPAKDEATGIPLLELPEGFRYRSLGWIGEPMSNGLPTPERHDGMAVVSEMADGRLVIVRNHEVFNADGSFAADAQCYDSPAGGGTTTLIFDPVKETVEPARPSLSGTVANCAGGPTPHGSWLTCEEVVIEGGKVAGGWASGMSVPTSKPHGYVFEVPALAPASALPIKDMGQFAHEAVAVDPSTGIVYLTEDRRPEAGLYRFIPNTPGIYLDGGRLQMLRAASHPDLREGIVSGAPIEVSWVDIEEPDRANSPGENDGAGCVLQGKAAGGSVFTRLEGCWLGDGSVFFTSTDGGDAESGQIFRLDVTNQTLTQVYQSPAASVLDAPDNITLSPNGTVVICEDGDRDGMLMHGLTQDGLLFPIARNITKLRGEHLGIKGNYRDSEWCGACFSPDGRWLFANLQKPGITVAITGPWTHSA